MDVTPIAVGAGMCPSGIGVIVGEDLLRAGVCLTIRESGDLSLGFAAAGVRDLRAGRPTVRVALVVLDLDIAGMSAPAALAAVRRETPGVPVLGISRVGGPAMRRQLATEGPVEIISAGASSNHLLSACRSALSVPIATRPPIVLQTTFEMREITDREREVLTLIANALPNKAIASRLGISEGTVKRHTNNLYRKLQVTSRVHALLEARRLGYVA